MNTTTITDEVKETIESNPFNDLVERAILEVANSDNIVMDTEKLAGKYPLCDLTIEVDSGEYISNQEVQELIAEYVDNIYNYILDDLENITDNEIPELENLTTDQLVNILNSPEIDHLYSSEQIEGEVRTLYMYRICKEVWYELKHTANEIKFEFV